MSDPYAKRQKQAKSDKEPLSYEQSKKMMGELTAKSKKFSGIKRPSIDVMECVSLSGKPANFVANGHLEFDAFEYACRYAFFITPTRIRHAYHREVWKTPPEGSNGHKYCTTELCQQSDRNAKPITIGYP